MHKVALAALAVACLAESGMAANCYAPKKGKMLTLSQADIDTILERHNFERDLLTSQGFMDIKYMKWKPELQQLAETLAGSCKFAHSTSACRSATALGYCGENLAAVSFGSSVNHDIYEMCNNWNKEKKDYNTGNGKCKPGKVCGHYTQVVWPDTEFVGCAVTECQSGILSMPSRDIRCVYSKGGNYGGELAVHKAVGECQKPNKCGKPDEGHCGVTGSDYHCDCHAGYENAGGKHNGKCIKKGGSAGSTGCKTAADCNNNGQCSSTGKCLCNSPFTGQTCQTSVVNCKQGSSCVNGHCDTKTDRCICNAGWSGNSCSLKADPCSGFCKHGKCTSANNVATCAQPCDKGWQGARCDTPAGGAWVPQHQVWKDVDAEVTKKRKNYGLNAIPLRSADRNAAVKEANTCNNKYHSDSEVDSHGFHTWGMMICMDVSEDKFTFGSWLGSTVIAGMAKFATSKWTTGYGCALSGKSCPGVPGYCSGKAFRMLICDYELKIGHGVPQKDELRFMDEATPPQTANAGSSIIVPVLAAVCVALAAVVVVLAIKVRRANQAPAEYNEMA